MCSTCGCGHPEEEVKIMLATEDESASNHSNNGHDHDHDHHHHHHHHDGKTTLVELEANVLRENDLLAQRNRGFLDAKNVFAINMVSSPGAGKTTLLEQSINILKEKVKLAIIEGDQQTMNDANRIAATGVPVVQVNTGKGCHLDAHMITHAMKKLEVEQDSLLFIENVGNLVCPSMFDLGEDKRVVIISVTEGDDKPQKYPYIFESSQICIINKIDLLPYVDFEVEKLKKYALQINPHLQFFELSASTGIGMTAWLHWLRDQLNKEIT